MNHLADVQDSHVERSDDRGTTWDTRGFEWTVHLVGKNLSLPS